MKGLKVNDPCAGKSGEPLGRDIRTRASYEESRSSIVDILTAIIIDLDLRNHGTVMNLLMSRMDRWLGPLVKKAAFFAFV
jgi:hypothetical protein